MLVGVSEGGVWRYEIVERTEGFVVRPRDLATGALEEQDEAKLFRTAAVAFAYADMSAALERYADALTEGTESDDARVDLSDCTDRFRDLSGQLVDIGADARVLEAWDAAQEATRRRRYH